MKRDIKNITPKHMRCGPFNCPAIYEVTPAEMRCAIGASCPSIFTEGGAYLIIGKKVETVPPELLGRIGPDELLIAVPKPLLADVEREWRTIDGLTDDIIWGNSWLLWREGFDVTQATRIQLGPNDGYPEVWWDNGGETLEFEPTHFMPLPSPPKPLNEREQG